MPVTLHTAARSALALATLLETVALSATPIAAQAALRVTTKAELLSQLHDGPSVRVSQGGAILGGRFEGHVGDSLALYRDDQREVVRIPLAEPDTLWTRERDHVVGFLTGAMVGGGVGGLGMTAFSAGFSHGTSERCNCAGAVGSAVAVGVLLGGAIDGALGSTTWRTRWPN